jgi:PAS domain S-box-containing protein
LIGLLTLGEYALRWNPGLDQWLFVEPASAVGTSNPGRMAPETALCFAALTLALWLVSASRKTRLTIIVSAAICLMVAALALAAILSYATPVLGAYGWFGLTMMAMHTATLFTLLGMAVLGICWRQEVLVWAFGGKFTAAFLSCVALMTIIGLNTSRAQFQSKETEREIAYSEQVITGIHDLTIAVLAAQSHTRGYVITGDDQFFTNYLAANAESYTRLESLHKLVADHPHQQRVLARIEAPVRAILPWFQQVIDGTKSGMSAHRRNTMVLHGEALLKDLTDAAHQVDISHHQDIEQMLLVVDNVANTAYVFVFAGTLCTLLIFLATIFRLNAAENERKLAQATLEESEEDLAITLNSIGDAVIATDPAGRVTRMNPAAERLTGWRLADAMGRSLTEVFRIINADTREPVADPVQLVMARGQVVGLANHTVLLSKGGQEYQIADSAAPIRNDAGDIVGVVLVFSNVTEKYQAETLLRESEARLRSVFDAMSEGFSIQEVVCDGAGKPIDLRFIAANPAFERQTGLKNADTLGQTLRELFPQAEPFWVERYGNVALSGEPTNFDAVFGPLNKHYQVSAFQVEAGRVGITFMDISERKQREAQQLLVSQRMDALLKLPAAAESRGETEFLQYGLELVEALTGSQIAFFHFVNDDQETIELLTWSQAT